MALFLRRVAILFGIAAFCVTTALPVAEQQSVTWTAVSNATVSGAILQKTSGWDGVDDAGAFSTQAISFAIHVNGGGTADVMENGACPPTLPPSA